MNIYNTLYILEYTRDPYQIINNYQFIDKFWYLNLSKDKYNYKYRSFDLYAALNINYKYKWVQKRWLIYGKYYRIIGPEIIQISDNEIYKYFDFPQHLDIDHYGTYERVKT